MNITEYEKQFTAILEGEHRVYPYDSDDYVNYVKMNLSRIKRWNKKGKILPSLEAAIIKINSPQHWLLITEPWCGDAAHSQAFITKLADLNAKITLTLQNRDAPGSEIDKYLTNGGKSIPMLVVRNEHGKDLFRWGPRPAEAQEMVLTLKENPSTSLEELQKRLQLWYNKDKGVSIQEELLQLIHLHA